MDSSRSTDRVDIVKLIVILVLLVILIGAALASGLSASKQQAGELPEKPGELVETLDLSAGEGSGSAATAVATAVGVVATQPGMEGLPALPAPDQELTYNPEDGTLSTEDGDAVYVISADGATWVPVVPPDLQESMDNPSPTIDANGLWVLVDSEGMVQYQWDESTLTWEKVEVAYLPALPGEAQPTAQPAAQATETPSVEVPAATPAGTAPPEQAGGATPTQAPSTGEAGASAVGEAAPVEIPASLLSVPKTYTLNAGEFPFCLARRFDVNPMDLLYLNGLNENSIVFTNTRLRIPTSGRDFPPPRALMPHPDTYTVKAGDTIYTIACKYGDVYPEAIAYANQLSAPYRLQTGQSLYIP